MSRGSDRMTSRPGRAHIVVIMHSVLNLKFFWEPILEEMTKDFDVTLYVRNDYPELAEELDLPCRVVFMQIERKIAPWKDLRAMFAILRQLRRDKPDLLQTITPKAGFLGMLAGRLAGVPGRVHTYQGEVWATATGAKRTLYRLVDKLTGKLATAVLVVSQTELEFLHKEEVLRPDTGQVLGSGSISGVDLTRFDHQSPPDETLRAELGLDHNTFVFIYLGRLRREKGLLVLAEAYADVRARTTCPTKLLVVGPDEDNIGPVLQEKLGEAVIIRPYSERPEDYLRLADVLTLPSFREGFGSVLIEAAALGLPCVASRIYGIDCAVIDGETGLLFEVGNSKDMADAMVRLLDDEAEYRRLADAGLARVRREFYQELVISNLMDFYRKKLAAREPRS